MISKAYFTHFIDKHVCDDRFIQMAKAMGMEDAKEPMDFITMLVKLQEDCGVADLKMSDYGIKLEEFGMEDMQKTLERLNYKIESYEQSVVVKEKELKRLDGV